MSLIYYFVFKRPVPIFNWDEWFWKKNGYDLLMFAKLPSKPSNWFWWKPFNRVRQRNVLKLNDYFSIFNQPILLMLCIWVAFPMELVLRSSLVSAKSGSWTIANNGKASALCYITLNSIYFFNNLRMISEEKKSVLFSEECSGTILYDLITCL